jgi:hypothetical protein
MSKVGSSVETLSKIQIAELQLNRALALFLDDNDFVSAITLAGASEEITGKLLECKGQRCALRALTEFCIAYSEDVQGREVKPKQFVAIANHFRDGLKHVTDGKAMAIPRQAVIEILDRAVENYFAHEGTLSPLMERFMRIEHDRKLKPPREIPT